MNAWLLTWEGTEGPALSHDTKIAAILSGRLSSGSVESIVDVLYTRCVWTAAESAHYAHKRHVRERQFKHVYSQPNRIFYGRNPCIFARIVSNLVVKRDEHEPVERVIWTEPSYMRIEKPGTMPVEVTPPTAMELTRALEPLVQEIYPRTGSHW